MPTLKTDIASPEETDAAYKHSEQQVAALSPDGYVDGIPFWCRWAFRAAFLSGAKWQRERTPQPLQGATSFKLNSDHSVAVATDVFWNEDMKTCPRGCKVQLLGLGGVAQYGIYTGDPFWVKWSPLPRNRPA